MVYGLITLAAMLSLPNAPPTPVFPDALLGRWTKDVAHCGLEDARGVQIDSDKVQFFEVTGLPRSIAADAEGIVTAEMQYSGEGRTWVETNRFSLSSDLAEVQIEALSRTLVLQRCPVILDLGV